MQAKGASPYSNPRLQLPKSRNSNYQISYKTTQAGSTKAGAKADGIPKIVTADPLTSHLGARHTQTIAQ